MEPMDPADLRISDSERHAVAEVLREAAGDGRIDLEELDERLEATYAARTFRDLVPITLDLGGQGVPAVPSPAQPVRPPVPSRQTPTGVPPSHDTSLAILSETRRSGPWDVGSRHTATAFMGSVVLDLRQARFAGRETVITASAVWGSIEVIVDAWTIVHVQGAGIMGTFQERRAKVAAETDAQSPVVRITGLALMGSVEVKRRGEPGELGRRIRGHLGH